MPPYADIVGRYYANDSGGGNIGLPTSANPNPSAPPQAGGTGGPTGSPMSGGVPGEENTGTGAPKAGSGSSASSGDSGSCQIGHGRAGLGASLFALFGLAGFARRRRRAS